jgi:hypothetical protein
MALALLLPGLASATPVKVLVKRSGLQFTAPCQVRLVPQGEDPEKGGKSVEAGQKLNAEPGRYLGIISCPSTEGMLTKSVQIKVRRTDKLLKARVRMNAAFIVPKLVRSGAEVPGHIRVFDRRGVQVAEGPPRDVLVVPAESLHLVAEMKSKPNEGSGHVVLGVKNLRLGSGQKKTPTLDLSDAHMTVQSLENGKGAPGLVMVRLPGTRQEVTSFPTGKSAPVPPGTFDIVTQLEGSHDFHEEKKRSIKIKPGQRIRLVMRHQTARLKPRFSLGGSGARGKEVEVDLYLGSAPAPFATLQPGEDAKVKPGTYRAVARIGNKTYDDGGPWSAEAKTVLKAGQVREMNLDLRPARLEVETRLFDRPAPVTVQVFAPNNKAPIFEGDTDKKGALSLKMGPGPIEILAFTQKGGPTLKSPQKRLALKRGQAHSVSLVVEAGQAVVQVFDAEGFAVSAEVTLRQIERRNDPGITFNAGEEVAVPPGIYGLQVTYQGKSQEFGKLKVSPSRTAERQVVLP